MQVVLYMCKACIESFIEFTIPRAIQNPVMQKVCPNGLLPIVPGKRCAVYFVDLFGSFDP